MYSVSYSTKRLVCHDRSEGCILSYSDHQETQEVPQIRFRGQSVSITCPSFRISPGSTNLHEMHGRSSGSVAAAGCSSAKLPGRLLLAQLQTQARSHRDLMLNHLIAWAYAQILKRVFDPLPTDNLFRDRSGFSRDEGTIVFPTHSVFHVMPSPLQSRSYSDGEFVF